MSSVTSSDNDEPDSNKHASTKEESVFKSKCFFNQNQTKNLNGKSDNIFFEFENQMPSELEYDQFRCNMCDQIAANSTEFMEHEKTHYQTLLTNNPSVSPHKLMTLDDDMSSVTSSDNDDNTYKTASNDRLTSATYIDDDEALDMLDYEYDSTTSDSSNNDADSMHILDYDSITSNSSINDMNLDICDGEILCTSCQCVFSSASEFEEHHQNNVNDNLRICKDKKDLLSCPNEHRINTENDSSFNSNIKVPDQSHLVALNEISLVQGEFDCEICNTTCDQLDHFQFNQWWSSGEPEKLKCYVCYEEFFDKEQLKQHEFDHVKLHFC